MVICQIIQIKITKKRSHETPLYIFIVVGIVAYGFYPYHIIIALTGHTGAQ